LIEELVLENGALFFKLPRSLVFPSRHPGYPVKGLVEGVDVLYSVSLHDRQVHRVVEVHPELFPLLEGLCRVLSPAVKLLYVGQVFEDFVKACHRFLKYPREAIPIILVPGVARFLFVGLFQAYTSIPLVMASLQDPGSLDPTMLGWSLSLSLFSVVVDM